MIICPADGTVVCEQKEHTREEAVRILETARASQRSWEKSPVSERKKIILNVRTYLVENSGRLTDLICRLTGKTQPDTLGSEVLTSLWAATFYSKSIKRYLRPGKLKGGPVFLCNKKSRLYRKPFGVIGIIGPWNYSFNIPFHEVCCALLTGNSVVLKVATQTQPVGAFFLEAFKAAGLPEGVLSVVYLEGKAAGDLFLEGGVDKLFFTGSTSVGQYLMAKASEHIIPLNLELGGKDAMIILEDVNLERAVYGLIWAEVYNTGQSCGGAKRVYVVEDVYDRFVKRLRRAVSDLRGDHYSNIRADFGSIATAGQLEDIKRCIDKAVADGALITAQAKIPEKGEGLFFPVTLLENVNHSMELMRRETFGPVIAVQKVKDLEEAVLLANDSDMGLNCSVWSKGNRRAIEIADRLECGAVMLNDHLINHAMPQTPWGGYKKSSIGRAHGLQGFDEATQPHVVIKDCLHRLPRNFWWHPNKDEVLQGVQSIIDFQFGSGIKIRIIGLIRVAGIFIRRSLFNRL